MRNQIDRYGKPKPAYRPSLQGWDDQRADLADIKDLLQYLIAAVQHSDKPPTLWKRPETALDRYEREERKKNTDYLYAQLGITGT